MKRALATMFLVGISLVVPSGAGAQTLAQRKEAAQFAKAVRLGIDPTVGGLIPVTADQAATLSNFKGCTSHIAGPKTKDRVLFVWDCAGNVKAHNSITEVFFAGDRVVRIEVSKAIVAPHSTMVPN